MGVGGMPSLRRAGGSAGFRRLRFRAARVRPVAAGRRTDRHRGCVRRDSGSGWRVSGWWVAPVRGSGVVQAGGIQPPPRTGEVGWWDTATSPSWRARRGRVGGFGWRRRQFGEVAWSRAVGYRHFAELVGRPGFGGRATGGVRAAGLAVGLAGFGWWVAPARGSGVVEGGGMQPPPRTGEAGRTWAGRTWAGWNGGGARPRPGPSLPRRSRAGNTCRRGRVRRINGGGGRSGHDGRQRPVIHRPSGTGARERIPRSAAP